MTEYRRRRLLYLALRVLRGYELDAKERRATLPPGAHPDPGWRI